MNLLGKITKTHLLLLFMTSCFLFTLFFLYETAQEKAAGTDYTITVTRRTHEQVTGEITRSPEEITLIDINTATLDDLQTLTGIGPAIAQRIIDYREENGPFTSLEDLLHVKGIGEATLNKFRDRVTLTLPDDHSNGKETTATEEDTE